VLGVLVALAWLGTSSVTRAEESLDVHWHAPPSCPDERAVRARVAEWLDPLGAGRDTRGVHVDAQVHLEAGHYHLSMSFRSEAGRGQEQLTAALCQTLVDVVALKAALAADSAATPRLVLSAARPRVRSVYARAAGGASLGVLSNFAPAVSSALGLQSGPLGVELSLYYDLPRDHSYQDQPGIGGRFSLLAGEARGCVIAELGDARVPLCVGALAGTTRAEGYGTPGARRSRQPWAALAVTVGVRWPSGRRWALWAEASALLSVLRPSYYVEGLDTLEKPDRTGARALIGLELHSRH
jgi:hypothetical protein